MSSEEMASYYLEIHDEVIARDARDRLSAIVAPNSNYLVNRFTDFAHRLGMKKAFGFLEKQWITSEKRSVLDLGCGRGRWSREYAKRGFEVTGVDLSPQAIGLLADEMRQHQFVCGDLAEQEFPDQSFDVVNSVTVLQHLPEPKQRVVLEHVSRWIKRGGFAVLLENVRAFDARHVFPHSSEEWVQMVEANGLNCIYQLGSNFEPLLRAARHARQTLRKGPPEKMLAPVPSSAPPDFKSRIKSVATGALAVASFPMELLAHRLPFASPTHRMMIFKKPN